MPLEFAAKSKSDRQAAAKDIFENYGDKPRLFRNGRSEEHTSELQSLRHLVCRLLLETKSMSRSHRRARSPPGGRSHPSARTRGCPSQPSPRTRMGRRSHVLAVADRPAFFFNDTATTEIYTLSLHDALPI